MGREIRRVPIGWEHPTDELGDYLSMYDGDYDEASAKWLAECKEWEAGTHEDQQGEHRFRGRYYWEWVGGPPDEEMYRSEAAGTKFQGPADGYQVYQTVSEGTPVSPVFASLEDMVEWLVAPGGCDQGYSREAAEEFAKGGWAPSMVVVNTPGRPPGFLDDIEGCNPEK